MPDEPIVNIPPLNKKVFFTLWAMCLIGFIAIIPYSYTLNGMALTCSDLTSANMLISSAQNLLLYGLLILTGMYVARRSLLGTPILTGLFQKDDVRDKVRAMVTPAVLIGVIGSIIILLLDSFVFGPPLETELKLLGVNLSDSINPPVWQGFLASFYGGINEEILLRLFVMTLIGGLMAAVTRKLDQPLPVGIFWTANILAAVLFGLGHLPA
ncbi:MAG: CPBP family intramembrane metalloprotease, partial [Anaerolineaceae bacterium]|nr:CPBP family intramembrane metalloprotease [Anaerolineaceae bacterium]